MRFGVAPGSYVLLGYRLVDGDWHVSVGGEIGRLEVRAGEVAALELGDALRLDVRAWSRADGAVQVQLDLTGLRRGGSTLYRGGRRVPAGWTLVDAGGGAVGQGPMEYG